jgi:glycosyltransferase involved in cell wall biosynthesis
MGQAMSDDDFGQRDRFEPPGNGGRESRNGTAIVNRDRLRLHRLSTPDRNTSLATPNAGLISVVTPTLNQAAFLAETIDSVLEQEYAALEYVVKDGGSTDDTRRLLERYSATIRWTSIPGAGQSAAINQGWRDTRGEIVAWLNSDDTYLPGALAAVAECFQKHPDVDVVYGECDYVDVRGRFLRPYPVRPHDYLRLVESAVSYLPQPATFLRRRVLESAGFLDEFLSYAMDLDFWLRIGARGHAFAHLPRRLATLRLHPQAKSIRSFEAFAPELIRIYERLFRRDDLPLSVKALRKRAMSNVFFRASQCYFWSGRLDEARRHALRAWRHDPSNIRGSLLAALSGRPGRALIDRLMGNPFRRGLR